MNRTLSLLVGALVLAACSGPISQTPVEVTKVVEVTREIPVVATPVAQAPTPAPAATPKPQPARTLTVLVGAGEDTDVVSSFFPAVVRVRVGDTVTWKLNSDELHTVSFNPPLAALQFAAPVPGGGPDDLMIAPEAAFPTRLPGAPIEIFDGTSFVSAGMMSKLPDGPDTPPNDTFSVTFTKPGTYPYLDILHQYMQGAVVVEPATADVPAQEAIDAQIKAEMEGYLAQVEASKGAIQTAQSAAGPDGSTLWFLNAGGSLGNPTAGTYSFGPKEHTVKAGDTVIWTSSEFHTITFNPAPPNPELVIAKPQENGPPLLLLNPQVLFPAKPAATYDPTKYYNSGTIGPGLPNGTTFALTFDKPGTYEYFCSVHRELGMKGTITVQ
jgi:plastocyanin